VGLPPSGRWAAGVQAGKGSRGAGAGGSPSGGRSGVQKRFGRALPQPRTGWPTLGADKSRIISLGLSRTWTYSAAGSSAGIRAGDLPYLYPMNWLNPVICVESEEICPNCTLLDFTNYTQVHPVGHRGQSGSHQRCSPAPPGSQAGTPAHTHTHACTHSRLTQVHASMAVSVCRRGANYPICLTRGRPPPSAETILQPTDPLGARQDSDTPSARRVAVLLWHLTS
jgi:hypothetical protein